MMQHFFESARTPIARSGIDYQLPIGKTIGDLGYSEIYEAITSIGETVTTLRLPVGTYSITTDLTIPANIILKMESGALFSIATTKTLTINGGFEAGLFQAFSCTGTGKVIFGPGAVKEFYSQWWGAVADGTTDDSAAILAAVTAAYDSQGGVVHFPASRNPYKMLSQLLIPNDGATVPNQPTIILRGDGCKWGSSLLNNSAPIVSSLDLRYDGTVAKLVTLGQGSLVFEDIDLCDRGSSSLPFVLTTNTALFTNRVSITGNTTKTGTTCDQDAFILGGTTAAYNNLSTGAFCGYGTVIEKCIFSHIRRAVYGRVWANAVVVQNNTVSSNCGSSDGTSVIEFDGTGGFARGNIVSGNLIEITNYTYPITLRNSSANVFIGNTLWDEQPGLIASVRIVSTAPGGSPDNAFYGNVFATDITKGVVDETGSNTFLNLTSNQIRGVMQFNGGKWGTIIRPEPPCAAETDELLGVYRSTIDGTNPNANIFSLQQGGTLSLNGTAASPGAWLRITNGSGQLYYDHRSIVKPDGDVLLYAGTGTSDSISIERGNFKLPRMTTAARTAITPAEGMTVYDTTLHTICFYNGTNWQKVTSSNAD